MAFETSNILRILAALLSLLVFGDAMARSKTDVIWLENGDQITGEIKQLIHGKLRVSTDSMGEVRIKWEDIEKIESNYAFQFEQTDGRKITGIITGINEQGDYSLTNGRSNVVYPHHSIIRVSQIEDTFWDQLKGSMTVGYSFTKGSNVAQGNLGLRATHRTEERAFSFEGNTIITNDQDTNSTQSSSSRFDMTRFRDNRWFNNVFMGFERNDELGLNLRSSLGAGAGRFLVQTLDSELSVAAGLMGSAESLQGGEPSKRSIEGVLGLNYTVYIFDDPSLNFETRLTAFPSLTEHGRTRGQLDINLRWEVINDLFWDLNYYNKYDSDPPSGSESSSDFGIVTSLGWSF